MNPGLKLRAYSYRTIKASPKSFETARKDEEEMNFTVKRDVK